MYITILKRLLSILLSRQAILVLSHVLSTDLLLLLGNVLAHLRSLFTTALIAADINACVQWMLIMLIINARLLFTNATLVHQCVTCNKPLQEAYTSCCE